MVQRLLQEHLERPTQSQEIEWHIQKFVFIRHHIWHGLVRRYLTGIVCTVYQRTKSKRDGARNNILTK